MVFQNKEFCRDFIYDFVGIRFAELVIEYALIVVHASVLRVPLERNTRGGRSNAIGLFANAQEISPLCCEMTNSIGHSVVHTKIPLKGIPKAL